MASFERRTLSYGGRWSELADSGTAALRGLIKEAAVNQGSAERPFSGLGMIGVRVLLLCRLRPGDIILETGVPRIAAAGGGLFGHASVALGRLMKIEAGKESGVEPNPFDFVAYRNGERRMVGIPIEPAENVCVLRRKEALDDGTIRGEALWEAGRAYSVPKLLAWKIHEGWRA